MVRAARRAAWLLAAALTLVGCRAGNPTPTTTPTATQLPRALQGGRGVATPFAFLTTLPPTPTATATTRPQRPEGEGVRPVAAPLFRPPDDTAFGEFDGRAVLEDEWRPPPYPVPLSLHPDDHYWLIRPVPSGFRNYPLEWFPYGNDVLVPELAPYRIHHGVDFPNDTGTPVLAASGGEVIWAGPLLSPRDGVNYYGNSVIIHHDWQWQGQDIYTLYAHTLELFVEVGDHVEQGQLIAGVGASGAVSGAHLHLEVRVGGNNRFNSRNPGLWVVPYEGWGTLAGRFTDSRGRFITSAPVTARAVSTGRSYRVNTYVYDGVTPDEIWRENFVIADLPADRYVVQFVANGITFQRTIDVLPGRTNFTTVQAGFEFDPTPTPPATAVITTTAPISNTLPAPPGP